MNKTVLIGIDGMTWDNTFKWIQEGKLPVFRDIIFKGFRGTLWSTIPSLTCPAVPSFYTGTTPVKTKVFSFRNQEGTIVSSINIEGDRLWDVLGTNGFTSFVSGVVTTYPAFIMKGVLVTDPFLAKDDKQFVWPPKEAEHFKDYFGEEIKRQDQLKWQKKDRERLYNHYMGNEERRFRMIQDYLENHDFDLKVIYFIAPDRIQHLLWDSQELILQCYQTIEAWVKQLMEKYPDHNFVLFSDHGFGPSPTKAFYINTWLLKMGYYNYKNGFVKMKDNLLKKIYYSGGWSLEKYLPIQAYEKMQKLLKKRPKTYKKDYLLEPIESDESVEHHIDSRVHLSQKWGLWINDEKFNKEKLIREMRELRDDNHELVFLEIYDKKFFYPRCHDSDSLPHIIFVLNPLYEARAGYNRKIFANIKFKRRQEGSHDNQRKGVIFGFGPDFKEHVSFEANIYDIAPTILWLYGLPLEAMKDMNGRIMTEIMTGVIR